MSIDPSEFAQLLGAEIVGEIPNVSSGPSGMVQVAQMLHEQLTPSCMERKTERSTHEGKASPRAKGRRRQRKS